MNTVTTSAASPLYKVHKIAIYLVFMGVFVWLLGAYFQAATTIRLLVGVPIIVSTICGFWSIKTKKRISDLLTCLAIITIIIASGALITFHSFGWMMTMAVLGAVSYLFTYLRFLSVE